MFALVLVIAGGSHAALPAVEHFFGNAPTSAAILSPDGRSLAVRLSVEGKRDALAVVDLASSKITNVAGFGDADVRQFRWVNNKRLVLDTTDRQVGIGARRHGAGLFAVDRDGANFTQLASRHTNGRRQFGILPWNTVMLGQEGAQATNNIYVLDAEATFNGDFARANLLSVDTLTGRAMQVHGPEHVFSWLLDQHGAPRIAIAHERGVATVYHLDAGGTWRAISTYNLYTGSDGAVQPLAFGPDGTLYVIATAGKDKTALYAFDTKSGKISSKPLIASDEYDFSGNLIMGKGRLLGARLLTDGESTIWFDEQMKAVQALVDQRMPATVNIVSVPSRAETPWVLVESYSDVQPTVFYLFDTQAKTLTKVGETRPGIAPAQMGAQDMVTYKARDGLSIPAWLTVPAGKQRKGLPMVVLVHGGPFVRGGSWGWDADSQFLASRGYAVLAPEFRGSTGFGWAHFRAGWKQWGLAMQDDIADGVRWAIDQGIADPKRICIMGGSYGGYATLMGLVRDPELYQCGINLAGVTDINLMYGHWSFSSDLSERYRKYGMPELVGDQAKDAEQLTATSPLAQAARIRKPLLLAYGEVDRRVPLAHGKKFYAEVKATNANVEWVTYPTEGHGLVDPKNRIDYWNRVEKFLKRHIGQ
jgi:dipeptidyl aminopeptidase/acylaminoacyl peptidase